MGIFYLITATELMEIKSVIDGIVSESISNEYDLDVVEGVKQLIATFEPIDTELALRLIEEHKNATQ